MSMIPVGTVAAQLWKKGIEKLPDSDAKKAFEFLLNKQPDMKEAFKQATGKALGDALAILRREDADYTPVIEMIAELEWFPCLWEALITGSALPKETFIDTLKDASISEDFLDVYGISFEVWSEVLYTRFNQEIVIAPDWSILIEMRRFRTENANDHATTHDKQEETLVRLDVIGDKVNQLVDASTASTVAISIEANEPKDREEFKAEYRRNLIQELTAELTRLKVETVKTALKNGFDHLTEMEQDECHGLLAEALVKKDVPNAVLALRSAYLTMERTGLEKHQAEEAWECGSRMMGLMLLGSIDLDWLYEHRHQEDLRSDTFKLVVQTFSLLGTEIAFAALNKLWPRFSEVIEYEKLKGRFSHKLAIDPGIVPESFVTTIKKILFKKMNPSKKIPEFDKPIHNAFLKAAIENRIIEKYQPYIVIDQQIAAGQDDLVQKILQLIKRDIPKITILPVSLDGERTVVLGEIDLQIHVAEFFASKMKFMQQFA